jgi:hypothetical protein
MERAHRGLIEDNSGALLTHHPRQQAGDAHDFYNPTRHPIFDRGSGRVIEQEGSYAITFPGNPHATPFDDNDLLGNLPLFEKRTLEMPQQLCAKARPQASVGITHAELRGMDTSSFMGGSQTVL